MITTLEKLPNEIFLEIFSNFSWIELITCFWLLNKRFNSLICSILSRIDNQYNSGLVIIEPGLSLNKYRSTLFSFTSSIRRIHFDGRYCNASDLSYEFLFDNDKQIFQFPNLQSLILTRCVVIESLMKIISLLIKHQLNELTLTFDEDMIELIRNSDDPSEINRSTNKKMMMFQTMIRQFFSSECRLTSLRIDIGYDNTYIDFHQCLKPHNKLCLNSIFNQYPSRCLTLRHLQIRLQLTRLLEQIIEYVPSLEKLCVYFETLHIYPRSKAEIETLIQSNGLWYDKVPKLQCFILETKVSNDLEFAYFKWVLNNLNHIQKLKIRLAGYKFNETDNTIWNSSIDANFIRRYCIADTMINLIHFDFYICSPNKFPMYNINKIIHSFKIHPFFIDHQWANIKCFFDPIASCQHVSSTTIEIPRYFDNLMNYEDSLYRPYTRCVNINLHPSLYLLLEQFDELFPNVFCIKVQTLVYGSYNNPTIEIPLEIPFEMGKRKMSDIQFRNVTRLDFGPSFHNESVTSDPKYSIDEIKTRAKLLAHIISMPVQLKDLRIAKFRWLLHVVKYASDELRKNALNTVRYTEFKIPSCHRSSNELIHIGKNLLPFLHTYMPHLQTLCLWRPDDFPWTSIRPNIPSGDLSTILIPRWYKSLQTLESINLHVNIFKQDLCQLVEQMKEFVFLDIHGKIHREKIEPYRSMVQKTFPTAQIYIDTSRFRLWL